MRFLIIIIVFFTTDIWAQPGQLISESIADCGGAAAILSPGTYKLQFTGGSGNVKDLDAYPSLKDFPEKNSIWCHFIAPFDGRLSIDATISSGLVQMIAFQNDKSYVCQGVYKGSSEVRRFIEHPTESSIGLSLATNENKLYPLDLKTGEEVVFLFNTTAKVKPTLDFTLKFEAPDDSTGSGIPDNTQLVDMRKSKSAPALNIMIRDVETGNPVVANITISGNKYMAATYSGSDFLFSTDKSGKISIKCDALGYFFVDREEAIFAGSAHEMVIWLQPLAKGKSIKLEDIEFQPGTSELMHSSEARLRRLKDFLSLNAGIKVEIQGHVNFAGENSYASQKLSESRARRVMNYLNENGIDKNRMVAKGYGNTAPVYERPKLASEEQANRRVEIKII